MKDAESLDDLLREAVEVGGSDLHLSVGAQPRVRVHGNLRNMQYNVLMPKVAEKLIYPLLDVLAKATLNSTGQYDRLHTLQG